MITLLSPAKSLDYETPLPTRKHSEPRMLDRSQELIDVMRRKSPDEVARLMSISDDLAALNVQRYQDFTVPFTRDNARPAVLAFTGDVYMGMDPRGRFGERDYTEAQKTVRILSGLYGVLRPLDLMQAYRLEMGTKLTTDRGDTLYDFWGGEITDVLNADLAESPGPEAVVNLASNEYFGAVDTDRLEGRLISPRFLDEGKDGSYRIVSFFAKRARGEMAAWLVTNRVRSMKAIQEFDVAGYRYDPDRSTSDEPTFIRPAQ
ncbi:peroxide stress protein YaaA [Euzebya rosea]|uniref:peroxide stress protein YaaA n=1 Tax=Euzebya rosea TaxID=2052804 RepID=UPI000D3E1BB7|nr:peroxide stress protein YaaA [Euzebya rosea]